MVDIKVDQKEIDRLINNIGNFIKTLDDFKKPTQKSLQILREEQRRNFDQQGYLYQGVGLTKKGNKKNNSWAPLKDSTKRQRKAKGFNPSRPILVRSGKLMQGFKITKLTNKEGEITNDVEYAKYHQEGTSKMPARKIIGTTRKSRKAIEVVYGKHIAGNLERYFKLGR